MNKVMVLLDNEGNWVISDRVPFREFYGMVAELLNERYGTIFAGNDIKGIYEFLDDRGMKVESYDEH